MFYSNTTVPTTTGPKKVRELKAGDLVYDDIGPTTILDIGRIYSEDIGDTSDIMIQITLDSGIKIRVTRDQPLYYLYTKNNEENWGPVEEILKNETPIMFPLLNAPIRSSIDVDPWRRIEWVGEVLLTEDYEWNDIQYVLGSIGWKMAAKGQYKEMCLTKDSIFVTEIEEIKDDYSGYYYIETERESILLTENHIIFPTESKYNIMNKRIGDEDGSPN